MNPIEQFDAEFTTNDPYAPLHDQLALNDDRMLEELVAMRKRKQLSQDVVAARMNRSKTAVSNFERLGADPHLSTIRRYAAAVGAQISSQVCDFDELRCRFEESSLKLRVSHQKIQGNRGNEWNFKVEIGSWATV